jgi:dienelactone hydrolase
MKNSQWSVVSGQCFVMLVIAISFAMASITPAQEVPATDRRATEIRHLDLTYTFTAPATKDEWLRRAAELRHQIMVSAGLWPLPERTPLNAHIFGRLDRGDYTVEKVYFESYPGHYVTGNLYRPKNVSGKAPAVLLPHGHWQYGRLEHQPLNSGPTRAANFARLGFVAFTWDMVGYDDSIAIPHTFASHKDGLVQASLWGVNLLGLQLWNSIRSVDFIQSLPDVDAARIGVTGESGGGTQTFLLSAVDDRIKVSAPVNMISSTMQGGSLCENAPNLRIDTNNMEIGALMAPRPMLMIAATGDWTKNTPTVEYPAIRKVYELFGAADKVQYAQFDAPHNYHRESREAVYGWFAHWLQGRAETTPIKEKSPGVLALTELLVFYGLSRPANELNEQQLTESLIESRRKQFDAAWPRDAAGLEKFKEQYGTTLKYALMAEYPKPGEIIAGKPESDRTGNLSVERVELTRRGRGDVIPVAICNSAQRNQTPVNSYVLAVFPQVSGDPLAKDSFIAQLVNAGHTVVLLADFKGRPEKQATEKFKFITTYNRADDANKIQDILTVISYLNQRKGSARLSLVGREGAGLWLLLAQAFAPKADRLVIDAVQFNNNSDDAFLNFLAIPDLRRAGDFATAVAIAPKTRLLIHNTGKIFQTDKIAEAYRLFARAEDLQVKSERLTDAQIIEWLKQH